MSCKDCIFDSYEYAIWASPEHEIRLMEARGIGVVRADKLKGNEKCGRCGCKITGPT